MPEENLNDPKNSKLEIDEDAQNSKPEQTPITIYYMNKDQTYASTTGSQKEIENSGNIDTLKVEKSEDSGKNSKNTLDTFNPRMFSGSLHSPFQSNRHVIDKYSGKLRKYSEPITTNGARTIFGH